MFFDVLGIKIWIFDIGTLGRRIVGVVLRRRCDVIIMIVDVDAVYVLLDGLSEELLLFHLFGLVSCISHWF